MSGRLGLADDVAVLPGRPGFDLVISKDAMVEGVHFSTDEAADVVARRLLRTSLSDLAAKAATPFGYFLMTAWPADRTEAYRAAFRTGLERDGRAFGVALLGGDTILTAWTAHPRARPFWAGWRRGARCCGPAPGRATPWWSAATSATAGSGS